MRLKKCQDQSFVSLRFASISETLLDSRALEANLELWKLIWYLPEPVVYHPGALERDHRAFVALSKAVEAHHGSMKAYPGALEANFVALEAIFKASWSHTG